MGSSLRLGSHKFQDAINFLIFALNQSLFVKPFGQKCMEESIAALFASGAKTVR